MKKYTFLVLSTQRNWLYCDITDTKIDYAFLWYTASKNRYVKLEGIIEDIKEENRNNFINEIKSKSTIKYFDSYQKLIDWLKK